MKRSSPPYLAYIAVVFAVVAWGGSFVAGRMILHPTGPRAVALSPIALATLRFSLASLGLAIPLVIGLRRVHLTARDVLRIVVLGQMAFPLYFWLQYTGLQKTNAGIASILVVGLIPLVTTAMGPLLSEERPRPIAYVALGLGMGGAAVIALQKPIDLSLRSGFLLGTICLLMNAAAFALYSHLSKRWMAGVPPLVMTGGSMIAGSVGLIALVAIDPAHAYWNDVLRLEPGQWIAVLFLAVVCSLLAYFAYNVALTRIPASEAASYVYLEPVVTVTAGAALLGERLTVATAMGAGLIALSIVALRLWTARRSGRTEAESYFSAEISDE